MTRLPLDPHPSPQALRKMAREKGVKIVGDTPPTPNGSPASRPWHPYRSKWEADYAKHLDALVAAKRVSAWRYEPERLEIGVGARYTPDFSVLLPGADRVEYREVKGYKREAAMVRLRAAAKQYPQFTFVLVTQRNGQWHHTTIGARG